MYTYLTDQSAFSPNSDIPEDVSNLREFTTAMIVAAANIKMPLYDQGRPSDTICAAS